MGQKMSASARVTLASHISLKAGGTFVEVLYRTCIIKMENDSTRYTPEVLRHFRALL